MGNARKEGDLVVRAAGMDVGKLDLVDSGTTPVTCTIFHHDFALCLDVKLLLL